MKIQEGVLPFEESRVVARRDDRLGGILLAEGKLRAEDIDRILELQRGKELRFGDAALRLGLIDADDLTRAIAKQYDVPHLLVHDSRFSHELVVACEPFHPRAEELRALRTQLTIRWAQAGAKRRVLAVVSPGAREGRSYVVANLAVAFSQLGERTLLIDADLRAPRQHRIFGIPDRVGLAATLSGRADRGAVVPIPEFGTLSVLPAGGRPPNPQELLLRPTLPALLNALAAEFDVILFDTPPAKLYADAQSLAFRAGSAVLLARKDHTRVAEAASVVRELTGTGARVVGTVLNAF